MSLHSGTLSAVHRCASDCSGVGGVWGASAEPWEHMCVSRAQLRVWQQLLSLRTRAGLTQIVRIVIGYLFQGRLCQVTSLTASGDLCVCNDQTIGQNSDGDDQQQRTHRGYTNSRPSGTAPIQVGVPEKTARLQDDAA